MISGKRKFDRISRDVKELGMLNAHQLVEYHQLCLVRSILATGEPPALRAMFVCASHNHDTRRTGDLRPPRVKTNAGKRRLSFASAERFNALPPDVRHCTSRSGFKGGLLRVLRGDV